jgi:membrane associated rhomboid family serine protease
MLIPVGQENNEVRRQPWVSYAIIALNFLVAIPVFQRDAAEAPELDRLGDAADQYLRQHPYLTLPTEMTRFYRPADVEKQERIRQQREAQEALPPGDVREEEQRKLQGLATAFLEREHQSVWNRFGYVPKAPRGAAHLTSLFVHGDWLHLLGNLFFFYFCGPFVEDAFGRPLFLLLYLVSGLAANLTHAAQFPESLSPLIGASGAIAGVMGAFLVRFAAHRASFLFIPFVFVPALRFKVRLPAFVFLPAWFLEQFWYASTSGAHSGVAFWAHVGGFAFGALAALGIRLSGVERRFIDPAIESKIGIVQHPGVERALDARNRGDWATARRELRRALAAEPDNLDAWREAYELALAAAEHAELERSVVRLADLYGKAGEQELADALFEDLVRRTQDISVSPRLLLAAAQSFERRGEGRQALEAYERIVAESPTDPAAFRALYRRGEVLRKAGDTRGALAAYEAARRHPACTDPWPANLDRTLAALSGGGHRTASGRPGEPQS